MPQTEQQKPPRLVLVTPVVADPGDYVRALQDALGSCDVAAVLLRLADTDERTLIHRVKALARPVQDKGAALAVWGRADIVARAGADGAHLTGLDAFNAALPILKPDRIAGVGGLTTRHDAMIAAEGGADYVMFGAPEDDADRPAFTWVLDRVGWWAELFQTPCIGIAASFDEVDAIMRARAEFVAVCDLVWNDPCGAAQAAAAIAARLDAAEPVT
jgi:thiamine-phosphate pyrophosphorylase